MSEQAWVHCSLDFRWSFGGRATEDQLVAAVFAFDFFTVILIPRLLVFGAQTEHKGTVPMHDIASRSPQFKHSWGSLSLLIWPHTIHLNVTYDYNLSIKFLCPV